METINITNRYRLVTSDDVDYPELERRFLIVDDEHPGRVVFTYGRADEQRAREVVALLNDGRAAYEGEVNTI
jgi:hypothetical protein